MFTADPSPRSSFLGGLNLSPWLGIQGPVDRPYKETILGSAQATVPHL